MTYVCQGDKGAIFNRLLSVTWRLFYPPHCVLCSASGSFDLDLCSGCRRDLPWNRHACPRCALPLPPTANLIAVCANCQQQCPPYDQAWSAFCYLGTLRWLHRRLKFGAGFSHGRLLSQLLSDAMEDGLSGGNLVRPDVILVTPLHPRRLMRRGFNQSLELIRPAARRLRIELDYRCLRRVKSARPQSELPARLRRQNVKGAFACQRDLSGLSVVLFDDVVTTGETVAEATRALRRAGASEITVWSLARTPQCAN